MLGQDYCDVALPPIRFSEDPVTAGCVPENIASWTSTRRDGMRIANTRSIQARLEALTALYFDS
jgi:hypothetical protein